MCNHTYTLDYSKANRAIGRQCPYTFGPPIPLDATGACLFHSSAVEWKRENGFLSRFLQLLHILDVQDGSREYDFAEFVFVGDGPSGNAVLHLADLKFQKRAVFMGASFLDAVDFTDVDFANGATFEAATFHRHLVFNRVRLRGGEFCRSLVQGNASFRQTAFDSYSLFSKARFVGSRVSFEESSFEGISDFSQAAFELTGSEALVRFRDVQFKDFLDFRDTVFDSQVSFENVLFGATAEFIDTSFRLVATAARYRGAAVEFKQIGVPEGADLTFKSTSASKKLFSHDVSFSFKSEPQGIVRFENVNFNEISPASRQRLADLAKIGKVEIGSGCIKYRFQTEIRTIPISEGNASLILELTGTFANYFTAQNGVNLGLEVVGRTPTYVSLFYFTDEDIQEEEFLARLRRTEQDLWNLLAVRPDIFHLLDGSMESLANPQNAVINAVDGVSALIGTFFRVGIRIAIGRWREDDTRSLLAAIRFNPDETEARAVSLHKVLLGRYTGRNLVGLSRVQNEGLPAIDAVGRNLLTGSVEVGAGPASSSRVTILFLGANSRSAPLHLEKEVSKIQMNLRLAKERENLVFLQEWAVTKDNLMQRILDESPGVVHFSGHGEQTGILLEDPSGNPALVTTGALESLFKLFKDTVGCVVLNSCFSEQQASAIRKHIPYVIGVRSGIPNRAAIAFSTGFYKGIGAGKGVPFAFELGKVAMELWGVTSESAILL